MRSTFFLLLLIAISSGCCTYQKCFEKYGTGAYADSVVIDTLVRVEAIAPKDTFSFIREILEMLLLEHARFCVYFRLKNEKFIIFLG